MKRMREKRVRYNGKDIRHSWIVHGKRSSIEFHCAEYDEEMARKLAGGLMGTKKINGVWLVPYGVEEHSRHPMYGKAEPDHEMCPVLNAPCWHDGSSMAASDFFSTWHGDDELAFMLCERWLEKREEPAR